MYPRALLFVLPLAFACARPASSPAPSAPGIPTSSRRTLPTRLESPAFERAVERGTRTRIGEPGPRYWQQWARYRLAAALEPQSRRVSAEGRIQYLNRSPDTLRELRLHLHNNLFDPNAPRNESVPAVGGVRLSRVVAQGVTLTEDAPDDAAGYSVNFTQMRVRLPRPLIPGDSAALEFAWSFPVPPDGAPRTGTDGEIHFIAYWYPQVAVYDDVNGWQDDPYLAQSEFYMGYGDYDVSITVPAGWLVGGTGTLANAEEVLTSRTRARLDSARRTGAIVHVVRDGERGVAGGSLRATTGTTTWRYTARSVRDFAFGASDAYLWDATTAAVGDRNTDGRADTSLVFTYYRPSRRAWAWDQSARFTRHSVEFLSQLLWPYPYPQMTAMDGVVSCSGMEYPMLTCVGGRRDTTLLYSVIVHETGHMWFPMQVGSDEKRYAWQDEGLTRYNQILAMESFFRGTDRLSPTVQRYLSVAGTEDEEPLMRHGDHYKYGTPAYGVASYEKMATNLSMLRSLLGDETFLRAYRTYGRQWVNKHPTPYDFFNAVERVAERDLDWFWRAWWFETWTLEHRIAAVRTEGAETVIEIEDRGLAPMPVRVAITRTDGSSTRLEVPVETWLSGATRTSVRVASGAGVSQVEIDPDHHFAYRTRTGLVWIR